MEAVEAPRVAGGVFFLAREEQPEMRDPMSQASRERNPLLREICYIALLLAAMLLLLAYSSLFAATRESAAKIPAAWGNLARGHADAAVLSRGPAAHP
jgi:hypothetical protein